MNGSNSEWSENLALCTTRPFFACLKNRVKGSKLSKISGKLISTHTLTNTPWRKSTSALATSGMPTQQSFLSLDLTSRFWQDSWRRIATIDSIHDSWVRPISLDHVSHDPTRMPCQFSAINGTSTMGIQNVLIYIDDTLVHTDTHEKHLQVLEQVFTKLQKNHLKINLYKCFFGDDQVSYLEFTLTPSGIKPGEEKLKAIKNAATPSDIKSIQSFIRLCNFFRNHIQNFAITAAPLFKLAAKIQDTLWRHYQHQHCVPSRYWNDNSAKNQP